ncbi:hypothetical protein QQ008_25625 [Fulvivirgaceae bacterium BMA10]|uniref:Uncharacterized protein n=1 Tax=Splendidivirga corallicola TaxID=3051826 RepID=A0ABT8KVI8_9BACT|nr:hypothetical protein [Fulvivirgaceae bacterium BMA10]
MKLFHKISSFFLAILVLAGSTGFTVNKHYCQGELQKVTFTEKVKQCPMCTKKRELPPCHKHMDTSDEKCCQNETELLKVEDYNKAPKVNPEHKISFEFITLAQIILLDLSFDSIPQSEYLNYKPPLIAQDIPVLVQSFLL